MSTASQSRSLSRTATAAWLKERTSPSPRSLATPSLWTAKPSTPARRVVLTRPWTDSRTQRQATTTRTRTRTQYATSSPTQKLTTRLSTARNKSRVRNPSANSSVLQDSSPIMQTSRTRPRPLTTRQSSSRAGTPATTHSSKVATTPNKLEALKTGR